MKLSTGWGVRFGLRKGWRPLLWPSWVGLNPRALPNLAAWYDASVAASTTSDLLRIDASNRVSLIADRSGNSPVNVLCLNGVAGNSASLADSAALSITGDIDIQARLAMDDWTPSATQDVVGKWTTTGNQRSYVLQVLTSGVLVWTWSTTGSDSPFFVSSVAPTVSDLAGLWVRVTMDVDNGSGQHEVRFWTGGNSDTPNWVQLGSTRTGAGTTSIFDSTATLFIGARDGGSTGNMAARIFRTRIYAGLTQADLRLDANFALANKLVSSFTESSANAATVTINSSGDTGARIAGERDLVQLTASKQPIYLPWSGVNYYFSGNVASTSASASSTGSASWEVVIFGDLFPSGVQQAFIGKTGSVQGDGLEWYFGTTTSNRLRFAGNIDGTTDGRRFFTTNNDAYTPYIGTRCATKVEFKENRGDGNAEAKFYISTDFSLTTKTGTWVQVGGTQTLAAFTQRQTTSAITVGAATASATTFNSGAIFYAQISRTVGGAADLTFDPSRYTSGTTFTASTGETWTLNGGATIVTATSLYFDGTNDYMKAPAFSLSQPVTAYYVGSQGSWTSLDYIFTGNASADTYLRQVTSSPNVVQGQAATVGTELTTWAIGVRALVTNIFNGASGALRLNRGTAVAGSNDTRAMNGLTIGAHGDGAANFGNITTSEMALYSAAHDLATRDRFALYAGSKWRFAV